MKICIKCKLAKPLDSFGKANTKHGYRNDCKACKNAAQQAMRATPDGRLKSNKASQASFKKAMQNPVQYKKLRARSNAANKNWKQNHYSKVIANMAKRRAAKLQATPKWAEIDLIDVVYQKAQHFGMEVDHVIPLKGKNVCGLHVWANLQLLDPTLNRSKGNRV